MKRLTAGTVSLKKQQQQCKNYVEPERELVVPRPEVELDERRSRGLRRGGDHRFHAGRRRRVHILGIVPLLSKWHLNCIMYTFAYRQSC